MSLSEEYAAGPPPPALPQGRIGRWLDGLDDSEREAAVAMLRNTDWRHIDIRDSFARVGFEISAQSIGAYRKKHHGYR